MLSILLPMAGRSSMFDEAKYPYPVPLAEVRGKPMIEHVIGNLAQLDPEARFMFVVKGEDCRRYHLDSTLSLLSGGRCDIVRLSADTNGALCSALMAIEHIDLEGPLVIANSDQIFEAGLTDAYRSLATGKADAGCICFDAVHPRWSYVREEDGLVVEAAEKNPISRNAIAGFYYFRTGQGFLDAAKRVILNRRTIDGRYFVSTTFNEIILEGGDVVAAKLPNEAYVSFFTPQRIEEYERQRA